MYKKTTLKNGLRIITVPMKNTRAVTVLILVGAGPKYESEKTSGISHFLEHMFFKGTKKRKTKLEIGEALDRVGGMYNAFTGKEFTGYLAKVDYRHFDLALDWVSDIFLNSKLEEKEMEKERGVIIEEMNMYLDLPMRYIGDLWEKLLYDKQPAGFLIVGKKENVKTFKRRDLVSYLKSHYSAKNTIVCLAGNINQKRAERDVQKYFKNIRSVLPKKKSKVIEKQDKPQSLVHFKKTDQTHLALGVRAYDLFNPEKYTQALLAAILGGFMSSRLFITVREEKGLAYYIMSSSETYTDSGYLVTTAGIRNDKVEEAINLILKEYKRIKTEKISKSELQKAKDYLKGNLALSLETSDAKASFYSGQELLSGRILTPEEEFKKVDKVTENDILKVAKDIFKSEKLNLVLIGPFQDKQKFQKLLKI